MVHLDINIEYRLQLNAAEFRVIGKLLAGIEIDDEEAEIAKQLNINMLRIRKQHLELAVRHATSAFDNASNNTSEK